MEEDFKKLVLLMSFWGAEQATETQASGIKHNTEPKGFSLYNLAKLLIFPSAKTSLPKVSGSRRQERGVCV